MKTLLTCSIVALSIAFPSTALAGEYGASGLGGSTELTWLFNESGDRSNMGYVCVTRDALEAMVRTADVARYRIYDAGDYADIEPINSVTIYADESGVYRAYPAEAHAPETLWEAAQTDENGEWFVSEFPAEGMGRACVDSGVAGAIQYLEQTHGIDIQE